MYSNYLDWDSLRPFKIEEPSSIPEDSEITESHIIEELLDLFLFINSPFICIRSQVKLTESNSSIYYPNEIQYHAALGDKIGLVQKLCGKLYENEKENKFSFISSPLDYNNLIDAWCTIYQGIYDLNRYGILPAASSLSFICQEASLTAQALAYALQEFIDEHFRFVIRLEERLRKDINDNQLTLQEIWFYMQSVIENHIFISKIIKKLYQPSPYNTLQVTLQGPLIFQCIYDCYRENSGNTKCNDISIFLLKECCKPYLHLLSNWIYNGELNDTYNEFVIKENHSLNNVQHRSIREYWDHKFIIQQENSFCLFHNLNDKILGCGKYIHMYELFNSLKKMDHLNIEFNWDENETKLIEFDINPNYYSDLIEFQYNNISEKLYKFLLHQERILDKLRIIKSTFLMDRCDLYIYFLQTAQAELQRKDLNINKINGFLDISQLNTSLINDELQIFVEPLNLSLLEHSLLCNPSLEFDITSITLPKLLIHEERITLNWKENELNRNELSKNELSLIGLNSVIGDNETLQYQLIHRYRVLLLTIHIHLSHARLRIFKFAPNNNSILLICNLLSRMQGFIQKFNSYISYSILKFKWDKMEKQIAKSNTLDEFLDAHNIFLNESLTCSLLSIPECLCDMVKIMEICLSLANYITVNCAKENQGDTNTFSTETVQKYKLSFEMKIQKLSDNIIKYERQLKDSYPLLCNLISQV